LVTGGAVQVLVARLGRVLRLPGVGLRLVDVPHKVVHHAAQLGHVMRDRSRLLLALPRKVCPRPVGGLDRHASLGPVQESPLRFVGRRGGRAGAARSAGWCHDPLALALERLDGCLDALAGRLGQGHELGLLL